MTLEERKVPCTWLDKPIQQFAEQMRGGTLPHAMLVCGARGIGKHQFVDRVVRLALCLAPVEDAACGECKACRLVEGGLHADLRYLQPEDKSTQIKIDAIRASAAFAAKSAFLGARKVVVISPADAMNINASNALLKTLEEPSLGTLLILMTDSLGGLLPTIRSRCQRVDLSGPTQDQAINWLQQMPAAKNLPADELALSLQLSQGAPFTALEYLDQNLIDEQKSMLAELAQVLKRTQPSTEAAVHWSDEWIQYRLSWMIHWLEQALRSSYSGNEKDIYLDTSRNMFSYIVNNAGLHSLFDLRDRCIKELRLLKGTSNPNKQLLWESLLSEWLQLMVKRR
jgi:DNA polymerase-3 subunit delta'